MTIIFDIVVPTVGRPELRRLLHALANQVGPRPNRIFLVDDRADRSRPPATGFRASDWIASRIEIAPSDGRGPATARNRGWRRSRAEWVVFLDDDVVPEPTWLRDLAADVAHAHTQPAVAASTGRITVPRPHDRRPTDWERDVAGLERAVWATADMAYRRSALETVGGFDEHFRHAFREDADLGLRVTEHGLRIVHGTRGVIHPVRDASPYVSIGRQSGNAADARMRAKHGRAWRRRAHVPRGRLPFHAAVSLLALTAAVATLTKRHRVALGATTAWAIATGEFAWRRIAPGPRDRREVATMITTSAVIPPVAVWHRLRGEITERRRRARPPAHPPSSLSAPLLEVVLVDRDGTIVVDQPYNGDPDRVQPMDGARDALDRLRRAGVEVAVVTNQSGVARGLLTHDDVRAVHQRIEALLGPFAGWWYCPHDDTAACDCRKPAPGLVRRALSHLAVSPDRCAFVGDTGADMGAARAAGVRGILVPNAVTLLHEIDEAAEVAPTLGAAVDLMIGADR